MNSLHTKKLSYAPNQAKKKVAPIHILIISFILLISIFYFFIISPQNAEHAKNGTMHAPHIDNKLPVALNGEWEYYDNRFLFPSDFSSKNAKELSPEFCTLPGTLPSTYGYGTYRLTFTFTSTADLYSLRLSGIQGSARIYIDGKQLSDVGFTSSLENSSEASKDNQYIVFPLDIMRRSHEIIIQISNFSNYCSGITSPIYFGTQINGYRLSSQFKFAESVGLMSMGVLAIFLIFILIFRIQIVNTRYLLLCTIMLAFHLIYSSNDLLTQPVQSWTYLILTRLYISSLILIGLSIILLAEQNCYSQGVFQKILKLYHYISPVFFFLIMLCPNTYLPLFKTIASIYLGLAFLHAYTILILRVWNKSYSSLMLLLSLIFCNSYFALQHFNSLGMVTAESYTRNYIFLLVAYVTSQLAYVALQVSKIYAGNARLAQSMIVTNKLKSEFISATSHELRTPLHGIINIIESADSKLEQTDTVKEQLHLVLTLARKMNSVINDLYGFYSSSERIDVNLKPINLHIEVNAVIEVFHYTSNNPKLILKNNLSPDALWVYADESKLWEILNNIIGNSVKYTEAGTIAITSKNADNKIFISITDTGIGIPEKEIHRIFEKSVRLDDAEKKAGGIGYGLYRVRQLVEQMNGAISVEWSKPGHGTCITFCLDACDPEFMGQKDSDTQPSIQIERNYLESFYGSSASLLVVDDNEDNLNILRTIFEDCSFSIDCAQNAQDALQLLDKHSYDIIILDVMMPETSGFKLCQTIRMRYSHFELPVLLLTACDSTEDILTGFWSGANDYIVKPANRIELRTRVFGLITLKQSVKAALDNEMLFLQAQIRPHFLYNTFNTISAIALTDGEKASGLIDDLALYLRSCFSNDISQELVTIETELGIVDSYVRIQQARFGNRLQYIPTFKTTKNFFLPPLTIQPLVENAIRHATLDSYADIKIQLIIEESDEFIYITVQDNGNGIEPTKISKLMNDEPNSKRDGIGLHNVNRRLKLHYGIPLEIQTSAGTGTKILIKIPLNYVPQNNSTNVNKYS